MTSSDMSRMKGYRTSAAFTRDVSLFSRAAACILRKYPFPFFYFYLYGPSAG